jgi:hypothetical protein
MIARLFAIVAWLTAGHAVLFALFWLLLAVPESNVAMLAASALAALAIAVVLGIVEGAGLVGWQPGVPASEWPRRTVRALPGVWLGGLLFVIAWNLVALAGWWWQGHRGEMDAWLMAQFGWSESGRLQAAAGWFFAVLSIVLGLSMALSLASTVIRRGVRSAARPTWLREAASPRRLVTLSAIGLVFLWLPWQAVSWRPAWLAPNWQEAVFVAAKLGVLFLVANVGWALALGLDGRNPT